MTELETLLHEWKAVYGELHPTRNPEHMLYNDSALALAVLMNRKIEMIYRKLKRTAEPE